MMVALGLAFRTRATERFVVLIEQGDEASQLMVAFESDEVILQGYQCILRVSVNIKHFETHARDKYFQFPAIRQVCLNVFA